MEEINEIKADHMYRKVENYIKRHEMIRKGDVVLAGVSGGGDSMAMLAMLKEYQEKLDFALGAVHVHHGIRGKEADRDEALVRQMCNLWEIPFLAYHYSVPEIAKEKKMGLEETGRMVRREAFQRASQDFAGKFPGLTGENVRVRIALAHNENDVAETLLHNLCRGTGLRGLASILPVRDPLIRPVLCLKKTEIQEFLEQEHIPYVTDSTNLTDDYTRNRIRHKVIPLLEEINVASVQHMAEAAELMEQAASCMERLGRNLIEKYGKEQEGGFFLADGFWEEEPAAAAYGILEVLERLSGKRKDFTAAHIKSISGLRDLQTGRKISLPYGLMASRTYGGIFLEKVQDYEKKSFSADSGWLISLPGKVIFPEGEVTTKIFFNEGHKIEEKKYTKWFDYDKIENELSIRTRQQGDYLIVDEQGSKKKLNRYFIDEKIPSRERDRILLLTAGSEVLWVLGGRINARYKITPQTRRILEIQYQGGKNNHE